MEASGPAGEPPLFRSTLSDRWKWRPACFRRPRALSDPGSPDQGPEHSAESVVSPLPTLRRSATAGSGRQSSANGRQSSARPSRTVGSLTAWQMLAADVQRDMDEAAAAAADGSDSRCSSSASFMGDGPLGRRGSCSSQLEQPGGSLAGEGQPSGSGREQEPGGQQSGSTPPLGSSAGGGSGSGSTGGEAASPSGSLGSGELDE